MSPFKNIWGVISKSWSRVSWSGGLSRKWDFLKTALFQLLRSPDPPIDFWLGLFGTNVLPWSCFPCHLSKIIGVSYQNLDLEWVAWAKPTFQIFKKPNIQYIGSPDPPIDFWPWLFGTQMGAWSYFTCHLSKKVGVSYQNINFEGVAWATPGKKAIFEIFQAINAPHDPT